MRSCVSCGETIADDDDGALDLRTEQPQAESVVVHLHRSCYEDYRRRRAEGVEAR